MTAILAIDTCGSRGYVGLFETGPASPLAEEALPERGTQEMLLPAISSVLAAAKCSPGDLTAVSVVVGPGSFTGVRIGLAAAKGLAEALGLPMISLSRLNVLACAVDSASLGVGEVHAWLDAGRGDVYTGGLSAGDLPASFGLGHMESRFDAAQRPGSTDVVVLLEPQLLEAAPAAVLVSDRQYRQSLMRLSQEAFRSKRFADTALLDAEYLRIPDAEVAMRAKLAAGQSASR